VTSWVGLPGYFLNVKWDFGNDGRRNEKRKESLNILDKLNEKYNEK